MPSDAPKPRQFQSPKGTRDFYPTDLLRRRYIEKAWRDTSIRHGFEEIEGPTFEQAELYTVKSGEGILSEMFNVFSGKDPEEVAEARQSGRAPLALRPEFTPTLARMYAARAGQLSKPTKWFTAGPYFRAEKPQRGRLREFCQWNVDVIGDSSLDADMDAVTCGTECVIALGLQSDFVVRLNNREQLVGLLTALGVPEDKLPTAFDLLDNRLKYDRPKMFAELARRGLQIDGFQHFVEQPITLMFESKWEVQLGLPMYENDFIRYEPLRQAARDQGIAQWCMVDTSLARGLAYYTGLVFEFDEVSGTERAICGGGRYDNLIELFGGPPTPAVGFGMGDVVLGNLLQDKGLMPEGAALLQALSAPSASLRPDVFVIANEKDESQKALRPLVAKLRRGVESPEWLAKSDRKPWDADRYGGRVDANQVGSESRPTPPLHTRHSYKATKNIGKLLQEAGAQHARFAAIIEDAGACTVKNLDTREEQKNVPLDDLGRRVAKHG